MKWEQNGYSTVHRVHSKDRPWQCSDCGPHTVTTSGHSHVGESWHCKTPSVALRFVFTILTCYSLYNYSRSLCLLWQTIMCVVAVADVVQVGRREVFTPTPGFVCYVSWRISQYMNRLFEGVITGRRARRKNLLFLPVVDTRDCDWLIDGTNSCFCRRILT